ncbi:MAG TPA: hypothetical protein P5523_04895 [Bacteroidales bacterium]|nr:hypothetical protein [Bacteroidales bacterium]
MSRVYDYTEATGFIREVAEQTESLLLEQLSDLLSRGLLVVEKTEPVLTQDHSTGKVQIHQKINLTLRDKEYIEKLEKENAVLQYRLDCIESALRGNKDDGEEV